MSIFAILRVTIPRTAEAGFMLGVEMSIKLFLIIHMTLIDIKTNFKSVNPQMGDTILNTGKYW